MIAVDLFYWTGILWWVALAVTTAGFGVWQMRQAWVSWQAIRAARRIPIPTAPYPTAPVEMRVTGQSFEEFIAVECARTIPEPER
jgi:hypothetical protein